MNELDMWEALRDCKNCAEIRARINAINRLDKIMTKKYVIDFFDAFDGWGEGRLGDAIPGYSFDDKESAITRCNELMKNLDANNVAFGEHFSVFEGNKEIYRGRK